MDAASHTGVDNMRELIESARYRPTSARFKLYIIDEVHMLSASAFNALLKTLEEPPEHVKFVLATTEIRKVPVTVLSRCQRFDLKRLDRETLIRASQQHREKGEGDDRGRRDGHDRAAPPTAQVRDGLSLLDQAIALGDDEAGGKAGGKVTGDAVRGMLGLADQARILDLLDLLMGGKIADALTLGGRALPLRRRSGGHHPGSARSQPLADTPQDRARRGRRACCLRGRARSRGRDGRKACHAGARPRLADAAEGSGRGADRACAADRPRDGVGPPRLRRRAAQRRAPSSMPLKDEKPAPAPSQPAQSQPAKASSAPTQNAAPPQPPRAVAAAGGGEAQPALVVESENPAPEHAPQPVHPSEATLPEPVAGDARTARPALLRRGRRVVPSLAPRPCCSRI